MTLTFLKQFETQEGRLRCAYFDVAFDSSYPTGGELLDETVIPGKYFKAIAGVHIVGKDAEAQGYLIAWNHQTKKLQVFYPDGYVDAAGSEVADMTNLATLAVRIRITGY